MSAAFVYVVDVIAFPIVLLLLAITVYAGLLHILLISLVIVLSIIAILVTKPQMQSLVLILSIANGLILFSIAPPLFQVSPMGFGEAVSETGTPNGNLKEVGNPEFGGLVASTPDSRKARHSEKNDKNRNKNDSLQSPTEPEEVKTPKTQPIIDSPHETAPLTLNSEKDKGRNDYIDLPALSIAGIKYSYYALLFAIFLIWIVARVVVTEILNAKREVKYDIDNLNANKGIVLLLSRGELQALTIIRGRWADFLESLRKKNGFAANIASNFVPVEVAGREIVFGCKSIDDFNKTRGVVASAYNPIIQKELRAFFGLPRSIIRFVLVDAEKYDAALNQLRQKGGELN